MDKRQYALNYLKNSAWKLYAAIETEQESGDNEDILGYVAFVERAMRYLRDNREFVIVGK